MDSEFLPGQRRSTRRVGGVVILLVLVAMAVVSIYWINVIAARYDTDPVAATDRATDAPTVSDSSPASPSSPTSATPSASGDGPSQIGETRVGDNTDTTLLQARKVAAPAGHEPAPGEDWFGIRAEICVHPDASTSGAVGWSSWLVSDDQGTNYRGQTAPWEDYPPEQLVTAGIDPGACAVGWVLVAVPEGTANHIATVVFRPNAPVPAEWTL